MAMNTPNLNLAKPDPNDYYDISIFNANMEKIDTAIEAAVAANSSVTVTFTADDWAGDDEPFTLTISQSSHKRRSADFTFDAYSLCSDGKYAKNTWAVLELDAEYTAATGAFKLMSDTKFAGKVVFAG